MIHLLKIMDQDFASQVKLEWELEQFNESLNIQRSQDRKDDSHETINNDVLNEIIELKKTTKELSTRVSKAESNIKKMKSDDSGSSDPLTIVSNEEQYNIYRLLNTGDDNVITFDDFIKKFNIDFLLDRADFEVIYDSEFGLYNTNEIRTCLIYDDNKKMEYLSTEELLEEFKDDGHYPIRFISYDIDLEELNNILNIHNETGQLPEIPEQEGIYINDVLVKSLDINVSYSLDVASRKYINANGFTNKTPGDEFLETEYNGMVVDDLNSDNNRDNDIMYNYIYFKLSICGYDVTHKIMNFTKGSLNIYGE